MVLSEQWFFLLIFLKPLSKIQLRFVLVKNTRSIFIIWHYYLYKGQQKLVPGSTFKSIRGGFCACPLLHIFSNVFLCTTTSPNDLRLSRLKIQDFFKNNMRFWRSLSHVSLCLSGRPVYFYWGCLFFGDTPIVPFQQREPRRGCWKIVIVARKNVKVKQISPLLALQRERPHLCTDTSRPEIG